MSWKATIPAAVLMLGQVGCALTSKSDPAVPRYFTPSEATPGPADPPAMGTVKLRLHRVQAGSHLKSRMVHRDSGHEIGFYEERRWAELPDVLLRRALSRALFEQRGLRRALSGAAPTLEVELIGFEEIRAPERKARVALVALLYDQGEALLERTIVVEQVVEDREDLDDWEDLAAAFGLALRGAVDQVADRVAHRLGAGGPPLKPKPKPKPKPEPEPEPAPPES